MRRSRTYEGARSFRALYVMRAIAKISRARASEHSSKFCEQIEQRPNFARNQENFCDRSIPLLGARARARKWTLFRDASALN